MHRKRHVDASNLLHALAEAARAAYTDDSLDPSPYIARVSEAVKSGWQPICRSWPELVDACAVLVFDETLALPEAAFPAPVEAWLLAQRTLDYVALADRQQQSDQGVFGLGFIQKVRSSASAKGDQPAVWQYVWVLQVQEFFPLKPMDLLERISTAVPTAAFPENAAVDLPQSPDFVLQFRDLPDDRWQLKLMASDLKTYVAGFRVELDRRQDVLGHLCDACRPLERRREAANAESPPDLRDKLSTELAGALRVLKGRLLRPPASVMLCIDRAELAKRIRRYAWARFNLNEEIKWARQKLVVEREVLEPLRIVLPTASTEYSSEIARCSTELDTAGDLILRFYESALERWLARLAAQPGGPRKAPCHNRDDRRKCRRGRQLHQATDDQVGRNFGRTPHRRAHDRGLLPRDNS